MPFIQIDLYLIIKMFAQRALRFVSATKLSAVIMHICTVHPIEVGDDTVMIGDDYRGTLESKKFVQPNRKLRLGA